VSAEPYFVRDLNELAKKLDDGKWIVFRHEYLGDVCDLATWTAELRDACLDLNVIEETITIPRKDLTIVFNTEKVPDAEEIQASVSRVELDRWIEREPRSELSVRKARGE
jgi:hypothetical protein